VDRITVGHAAQAVRSGALSGPGHCQQPGALRPGRRRAATPRLQAEAAGEEVGDRAAVVGRGQHLRAARAASAHEPTGCARRPQAR
jgi:hypothetical protein